MGEIPGVTNEELDQWDYDDPDDGPFDCPRCGGFGEVDCHCGGDLCVCENYGSAMCPVCYGEGKVSSERYDAYMKARAENARLWQEAIAKARKEADEQDTLNGEKDAT